jgi:hypothetical protein
MVRSWLFAVLTLALTCALGRPLRAWPGHARRATRAAAQATPVQIPLWAGGAPGFENRRDEPELAKDYWVRNIHNPSLTVYLPPRAKATGTGVVIFPGGGHRLLVFKAEGDDPARFLNGLGVAAFVLKYRLSREEGSLCTRSSSTRGRMRTGLSAPCAAGPANGASIRIASASWAFRPAGRSRPSSRTAPGLQTPARSTRSIA